MENNTIPLLSIINTVTQVGIKWNSSDYFIAPDTFRLMDKKIGKFRCDFYSLLLILKGWSNSSINNKTLHHTAISLIAIDRLSTIEFLDESDDFEFCFIAFSKDFLINNNIKQSHIDTFEFFTKNAYNYIRLEPEDVAPLVQVYNILKTKRNLPNSPLQIEIIRNLFFVYLYEAEMIYQERNPCVQYKNNRETDLSFKFQELIAEHAKMQYNLKFYADALSISPKYLIRSVKKTLGKTPGELIDESRIINAKLLLYDPQLSISSIAEQLQFSGQPAFSTYFKKHTGISPSQFRKA